MVNAMSMGVSCWRGGLRPQFPDQPQNLLEHLPCNGDLGHLEDEIATLADDLRANLDRLLLQARQRLVLDRLGRRQRAQEIDEIVGERMELSLTALAANTRHESRVHLIAPLPPLIHCSHVPALIVEGDDFVGQIRQVGDDEADARIKLARMPLDFGGRPARLGRTSSPIGEVGMEPTHLVRRSLRPGRLRRWSDRQSSCAAGRRPAMTRLATVMPWHKIMRYLGIMRRCSIRKISAR